MTFALTKITVYFNLFLCLMDYKLQFLGYIYLSGILIVYYLFTFYCFYLWVTVLHPTSQVEILAVMNAALAATKGKPERDSNP